MSSVSIRPLDDEWWTTAMVCSYLKLKRRALWDIRRDPGKAFPSAVKPGGKVNLFRAEDVRIWVAKRRPSALPPPSIAPPANAKPPTSTKPVSARLAAAEPAALPPVVTTVAPIRKPVPRKRAAVSDERQLGLF